jgi:hypothetical protein
MDLLALRHHARVCRRDNQGLSMKILHWAAALATLAVTATMFATTASAQATRTWVSGVGDDANPCSRTAPCKTFAGAISKTAPSGEINCLDPGGFGALTITKSIAVDCTGVEAGMLVSGTNGFVVSAAPTDVVVIRGIDIEGLGTTSTSLNGIKVLTAASVSIENCIIRGFGSTNGTDGNGVFVANSGATKVLVLDTLIENNANGGVWVQPQSGGSDLITVNRVQINNNKFGVVASDDTLGSLKINGTVRDSTVGNNSQNGITVSEASGSDDTLVVDNVSVVGNANRGLVADGATAGLLVSNSTIFGNQAGVVGQNSGLVLSYGNNRLNGNNGADGAFSGPVALH